MCFPPVRMCRTLAVFWFFDMTYIFGLRIKTVYGDDTDWIDCGLVLAVCCFDMCRLQITIDLYFFYSEIVMFHHLLTKWYIIV